MNPGYSILFLVKMLFRTRNRPIRFDCRSCGDRGVEHARKVKGFSRVDSGEAHGWLVRIKRGDIKRSRFISDSTHGGKRKSKLVAEKVYQDWVKELPEPDTAEDKLGKRNASGVVGVHYSYDVDARYPNCAYEYYIASWENRRRTASERSVRDF